MGAHSHHAGSQAVTAILAILEKEVDAAGWPVDAPMAVSELVKPDAILQYLENSVEPIPILAT